MLSVKKKALRIIIDLFFLIIILSTYFYFALDNLSEQGVYWDVGILGNKALGIYKSLRFDEPEFIRLFNKSFPLMLMEYHGPVEVYFFLPALYLFGNTAFALNIVPVIFGGAALFVFYILVILLYQSRILAILLNLLLSSLPTFIGANRIGFYTATLVMFFCLSSILGFLLWAKKGKFYWLAIAFLMLGFGIGSRCFFWWFPVAMIIFSVFFLREPLFRLKMLKLRQKIICLFSISTGIVPIIIYNLRGNFYTLRFFLRHLILSSTGVSNLNFIGNIGKRIKHLVDILEGNIYAGATNNMINIYILTFSLSVLLITIIYLLVKKKPIQKSLLFPVIVSLLVFLQSPFTPSSLDPLHILYILPLVLMISATAVTLHKNRYIIIILTFFLAVATGLSLKTNYFSLTGQKAHLILHGGNEIRWNIASDVLRWLKDNNIKRVGLGDTGIMDSLLYLSGYELDIEEIFYGSHLSVPRETKEEALRQRLRNEKEGYYLFRPPDRYLIRYFERFNYIAGQENKKVEIAKVFETPAPVEEPVFIIYRVSDIASQDAT